MRDLCYEDLRRPIEQAEGRRILIAADLDGTLAPIRTRPATVQIPSTTLESLWALAETGRAVVAIVSGRRLGDLAVRADVPGVLAGNHGLEIAGEGLNFVHPEALDRMPLTGEAVLVLREVIAPWNGAWVEDKGLTATVHFREVPAGDRHSVAMAVRGAMSRFGTRLGLRAGKCSLEVHPRIGWNKGSAVEYIRRELRLTESPVVCFGDDVTDESMFRVLAGHVTVSVGQMARTAAAFRVADPHAVGQALRALHDLLAGRRAAWEVGIA